MSNAARKARKRNNTPFVKAQKTPTPLLERAFFINLVPGRADGPRRATFVPRSPKSITRYLNRYREDSPLVQDAMRSIDDTTKAVRALNDAARKEQ
jgi:hypothetical protein